MIRAVRVFSASILTMLLCAWLTGCGTVASKPVSSEPAKPGTSATKNPAASTPGRGGYYLDDGPGDNPPADIDAIPDAQPRVEPLNARANRPYVALGENYTPMTQYQPYKMQGVASWYGRRYHNQKTSSGDVYDMYGMTAAHPTLPIPSYARVTNPENGRSVIVRVNDRGPFKKDRLIDLSYAAAYKLRLTGKGSGLVQVEAIDPASGATVATVPLVAEPAPQGTQLADQPQEAMPPQTSPATTGNFVQAGAFKRKENADLLRDKLKQQNLAENVAVENWYNDGIYRVRIGPYASRDEAMRAAGAIKQSLGVSTLVITQ
jgi:rare lipoprotein A